MTCDNFSRGYDFESGDKTLSMNSERVQRATTRNRVQGNADVTSIPLSQHGTTPRFECRRSGKHIQPISSKNIGICFVRFKSVSFVRSYPHFSEARVKWNFSGNQASLSPQSLIIPMFPSTLVGFFLFPNYAILRVIMLSMSLNRMFFR